MRPSTAFAAPDRARQRRPPRAAPPPAGFQPEHGSRAAVEDHPVIDAFGGEELAPPTLAHVGDCRSPDTIRYRSGCPASDPSAGRRLSSPPTRPRRPAMVGTGNDENPDDARRDQDLRSRTN